MKKLLIVLALVAAGGFGCRRTDVRDFTIAIPALTADDHAAITAALAPYGGVLKESLAFDDAGHRLTLRYDSMQVAKKNLEIALARIGFEANGVTPASVGAKPKTR